jgi:hypothetical protein
VLASGVLPELRSSVRITWSGTNERHATLRLAASRRRLPLGTGRFSPTATFLVLEPLSFYVMPAVNEGAETSPMGLGGCEHASRR